MYLLSCPSCQAPVSVTPAQAGDQVTCPECQAEVAIPKLGELRQLPQTGDSDSPAETPSRSVAGTITFVALSLVAVAALLGAAYNGIRWAMIESEVTTESHLEDIDKNYKDVDPAVLIREFEDMEKYSLDMVMPYKYQVIADEKARWGRNALIAAALAVVCGGGGLIAASQGRTG
ncbi:hypothetical protein NHH03_08670 [Stieleria sp. TO1_6]|uniref:hypothetical protein n=1 Tax=Stieleria tagensis TaxID=2956795 RepID=UPI00209B0BA3|nr:hypothetical protein [Stieleria tagensis]MCO8121808.1 hypothetical protein [Stieleria tagensis]